MKRRLSEVIEFPANPFVALTDFLVVLILILILAILHQTVSSSRLIERMAISQLQQQLLTEISTQASGSSKTAILNKAYHQGQIKQTWVDGDLQRFRLQGKIFFDHGKATLSSAQAKQILTAFGEILRSHEGNLNDPGSGLYKRIIVEGHADRSEGDNGQVWSLSLERASQGTSVLQQAAGLSPLLIEASGRGCWDNNTIVTHSMTPQQASDVTADNRRLEIVIVFSGERSMEYLRQQGTKNRNK